MSPEWKESWALNGRERCQGYQESSGAVVGATSDGLRLGGAHGEARE